MPLQNLVLAGIPNPVAAALTAITAGSEGSTMQADNLKTQEPSEVARLTSVFPHESYWEVDFQVPTEVQALALINHTLVPGDQLRIVGVESGSLPPVRSETLAPTAIEEHDNISHTDVGRIDEHPSEADEFAIFLSPSATDPGFLRLSFPTPTDPLATGAGYQCFVVKVETDAFAIDPADYSLVKASLWEGGVEVLDLGTKAVTVEGGGGQTLIFPWDAGELANADGSGVELRIDLIPTTNNMPHLHAVAWEVMSADDVAAADLDTGLVTISGSEADPDFGGTALQQVDLPSPSWFKFLDSPLSLTSLRVEFRGDGVGFFGDFQQTPPRNPATAIDAGIFLASFAYEFVLNIASGARLYTEFRLVGDDDALTGSNRAVELWKRRVLEVEHTFLAADKATALFKRFYAAGRSQAFLVSLTPGVSATELPIATFWATLADDSGQTYQNWFDDSENTTRSKRMVFREKL